MILRLLENNLLLQQQIDQNIQTSLPQFQQRKKKYYMQMKFRNNNKTKNKIEVQSEE